MTKEPSSRPPSLCLGFCQKISPAVRRVAAAFFPDVCCVVVWLLPTELGFGLLDLSTSSIYRLLLLLLFDSRMSAYLPPYLHLPPKPESEEDRDQNLEGFVFGMKSTHWAGSRYLGPENIR